MMKERYDPLPGLVKIKKDGNIIRVFGDGFSFSTTDATEAFQEALNKLPRGGKIIVSVGEYEIESLQYETKLSAPTLVIEGIGAPTKIVIKGEASFSYSTDYLHFRDMNLLLTGEGENRGRIIVRRALALENVDVHINGTYTEFNTPFSIGSTENTVYMRNVNIYTSLVSRAPIFDNLNKALFENVIIDGQPQPYVATNCIGPLVAINSNLEIELFSSNLNCQCEAFLFETNSTIINNQNNYFYQGKIFVFNGDTLDTTKKTFGRIIKSCNDFYVYAFPIELIET